MRGHGRRGNVAASARVAHSPTRPAGGAAQRRGQLGGGDPAPLEGGHSALPRQLFEVRASTPQQPAIVTSHKALFANGGDKGLFVESATQADFSDRVTEPGAFNFWATDEGVGVLDTPHAMSSTSNVKSKDPQKVDYHCCLGTQNGFAYRGTTTKGNKTKRFVVAQTNLGFFSPWAGKDGTHLLGPLFQARIANIRHRL